MENQVEKFDPSRLMEGVKDRVKATFVSLIPDTEWEEMIKKEINTFLRAIPQSTGMNDIPIIYLLSKS